MPPSHDTNVTSPPSLCALCQKSIDPAIALFGDSGQICDACGARQDMRANLLRSVKGSGYGTLGPALASWIFNPFFALTVATVLSAVWTFKAYGSSDEDDCEFLRKHRGPMIAAIMGLVIAVLPFLNLIIAVMQVL